MKLSFRPSEEVDEPGLLFGRNKQGQFLDHALTDIRMGTNFQIIGERRSGKSSALKCIVKKLLLGDKPSSIPIYLNFKSVSFLKGNANVFRYIIGKCVEAITKHGVFKDSIVCRGIAFHPTDIWENVYEPLLDIPDFRLQSLFEDFVINICNNNKIEFVLLIDEYEYLFLKSFVDPAGFFVLRDISAQRIQNGLKPLTFVIAGSMRWDRICTVCGSPELNNLGTAIMYLSPLSYDDFEEMWTCLTKDVSFEKYPFLGDCRMMFDYTGGIPFYAKFIGEYIVNTENEVSYHILQPYFEQIYKHLDFMEQNHIKRVLTTQQTEDIGFNLELSNRGLLRKTEERYDINCRLFKEYLTDKIDENSSLHDPKQASLATKVKNIKDLITEINSNGLNKNNSEMFIVTNNDVATYNDLETICLDKEDLLRFASALYNTVYERTSGFVDNGIDSNNKIAKSLQRLPKVFRYKRTFIQIIGSLRHHYGGHNTLLPTFNLTGTQLKKGELLEKLTGTKNEPRDDELYQIQEKLLDMFKVYLQELSDHVRKM